MGYIKSDMTDIIKRSLFQAAVVSILLQLMHCMDANKKYGEKAWRLHKNAPSNIEQILEAAPHKVTAVRPPTTDHEIYQN